MLKIAFITLGLCLVATFGQSRPFDPVCAAYQPAAQAPCENPPLVTPVGPKGLAPLPTGSIDKTPTIGFAVTDARNGELLFDSNAGSPLHPSWVSQLMVLYLAFDAVKSGRISMHSLVTVSAKAAAQEPPRLGLTKGQTIRFGDLIWAVVLRHSTDAATAIAEALAKSEAAFVNEMNTTAHAMCLSNTRFYNAQGRGGYRQSMSAEDAATLARFLLFDFPETYAMFSRPGAVANGKPLSSYLQRSLAALPGADGITTGFSRKHGYNAVFSVKQNGVRVIVSIMGSRSVSERNALANRLMQIGFSLIKDNVKTLRPRLWGCAVF